jgi:hypothetical protein
MKNEHFLVSDAVLCLYQLPSAARLRGEFMLRALHSLGPLTELRHVEFPGFEPSLLHDENIDFAGAIEPSVKSLAAAVASFKPEPCMTVIVTSPRLEYAVVVPLTGAELDLRTVATALVKAGWCGDDLKHVMDRVIVEDVQLS